MKIFKDLSIFQMFQMLMNKPMIFKSFLRIFIKTLKFTVFNNWKSLAILISSFENFAKIFANHLLRWTK